MTAMVETASVRVGHCCPDAPNVDVHVDGDVAFEDVPFEQISEYAELPAESHDIAVTPHGSDDPVLELTLDPEADAAYSALATGLLNDIECTVFDDAPGDVADRRDARPVRSRLAGRPGGERARRRRRADAV